MTAIAKVVPQVGRAVLPQDKLRAANPNCMSNAGPKVCMSARCAIDGKCYGSFSMRT